MDTIGLTLFLVVICLDFILFGIIYSSVKYDYKFAMIALAISLIFSSLISTMLFCDLSYKNGQVDAINGKIQYHLVVQEDSTRTWEKIDD